MMLWVIKNLTVSFPLLPCPACHVKGSDRCVCSGWGSIVQVYGVDWCVYKCVMERLMDTCVSRSGGTGVCGSWTS